MHDFTIHDRGNDYWLFLIDFGINVTMIKIFLDILSSKEIRFKISSEMMN